MIDLLNLLIMKKIFKLLFITLMFFVSIVNLYSQLKTDNYYISLGSSVFSTRNFVFGPASGSSSKVGFPLEFYFEAPVSNKISLSLMVGYVKDEYTLDYISLNDLIKANVTSFIYGVRGSYYLRPKKIFNPYIGLMIGALTSKSDAVYDKSTGISLQSVQNTETKFLGFMGAKFVFPSDIYFYTEIASSISILHLGLGFNF